MDIRAVLPPGQDSPYRGNYASLPVVTLKPPSEGNRTVPVVILWQRDGVSPSFTIHFNARAQQVVSLSQIAALHIDNTQCSSTINIVFPDTQFQLQLGPNSEGFYPVVTNSLEFYAYIDLAPTVNDRSVIQVLNFLPPPIEFGSAGGQGVGAGTVRQVDTVAPLQGGPITDQGTLSLTVPLPLNIGGTGAITANAALDNLSNTSGATAGSLSRSAGGNWTVSAGAGSGTISAVNAGTGITGGGTSGAVTVGLQVPVTVANGGTSATTAPQALTNLGAAPIAAPAFTGAPTAPTAAPGTNTTQLATTAFVAAATLTAGGAFVPLTGAVPMSGRLDISQNATIPTAPNALLHVTANNSAPSRITVDAFGVAPNYPEIHLREARGTGAAPTAVQLNDVLGSYVFDGYDGVAYSFGAQIYVNASENWTAAARGTRLALTTTRIGTTSAVVPMQVGDGVMVGVASDPGPGNISLNGAITTAGAGGANVSTFNGQITIQGPVGALNIADRTSGATKWIFFSDTTAFYLYYSPTGQVSRWENAGNFVHNGPAYKPGGGVWADNSDERVKKNVADYTRGLSDVVKLSPVSFEFNGLGGTEQTGLTHHGLIAQQVESIMPEMVGKRSAKLREDDESETDILTLDATALIYALVNSVKELSAQVSELQAKVTT